MFSIYDGREKFYQWDLNRKLIVYEPTIKEVHFSNCLCERARKCETYTEGNITLVDVPNELLQEYLDIYVYGYDGESTKHSAVFDVVKRTKPADYIYTPTERETWEELEERIEELEKNGGSGGSNVLKVEIFDTDDGGYTISHTPEQIQAHFREDGCVVVDYDDCFYTVNFVNEGEMYCHYHNNDGTIYQFYVRDYGDNEIEVSHSVIKHATKADITELEKNVGDIETALDTIIAIQNELIGGNS